MIENRPEKYYPREQMKRIQRMQDSSSSMQNPFIKIRLSEQLLTRNVNLDCAKNETIQSKNNFENTEVVESMQRRCQLEVSKQKQLHSILTIKLQQQIEFLKLENGNLKTLNKDLTRKLEQKLFDSQIKTARSSQNSPIINNQVSNLKIMMATLQKQHEHCISVKKELLDMNETLEMKMRILEEENNQIQFECKQYKKKAQSLSQIIRINEHYQMEGECLKQQIQSLKTFHYQKQIQFDKQLSALQKAISDLQYQNDIQENYKQNRSTTQISFRPSSEIPSKFESNQPLIQSYTKSQSQNSQKPQVLSQMNVLPNSFQKNSFNLTTQCYLKDQICLKEREFIEGLYRKNLNLLKDVEQYGKLQNFESSKNQKKQAIYNATKTLPKDHIALNQKGILASDRWLPACPNNEFSTKRRFRYL